MDESIQQLVLTEKHEELVKLHTSILPGMAFMLTMCRVLGLITKRCRNFAGLSEWGMVEEELRGGGGGEREGEGRERNRRKKRKRKVSKKRRKQKKQKKCKKRKKRNKRKKRRKRKWIW